MLRKLFSRLKTRQAPAQTTTIWPFGTGFPSFGAIENIPSLRKAISLYSDFLCACELKTKDDKPHYFLELLKRPHPMISREDFFEILCYELLVEGQFICRLITDKQTGKISQIWPYRANTARAYIKSGDYNDPHATSSGVYYKSSYDNSIWWPDEAIHLRDSLQHTGDMINGYSRAFHFRTAFNSVTANQNAVLGMNYSGGRGPTMLSGLPKESSENTQKVRQLAQETISEGLKETNKQVFSLPTGFELKRLMSDQGHGMLEFLAQRSDLEICKIFSVPYELIHTKSSVQTVKEVWRQWIKSTLKAFCVKIERELSRAVADGASFKFEIDKMRFSDLREMATYFSQMVQAGAISPKEASELVKDNT